MQTLSMPPVASPMPRWLLVVSFLGILWNVYGVYQYAGTFTKAGQVAMTAGMTDAQAAVYLSLPSWVSVVFAVGVFGGLVGSIAMALRRNIAGRALVASLAGYILLFAADAYYGVFAAIPSQLAILAFVVLVAAALLWTSRLANLRGLLR